MVNEDNEKNTTKSELEKKEADEKTEDDVGNEMAESQRCDGTCGTILMLKELKLVDCGHVYCEPCFIVVHKESHTSEVCKTIKKSLTPKIDSETSSEYGNGDEQAVNSDGKAVPSDGNPKPKGAKEKEWYSFLYQDKPIAVLMSHQSSYSDLIRRLATMIKANLETHDIILKVQPNSSSSSADHTPAEATAISVPNLEVKLCDLQIPKTKMWVIEVMDKAQRKEKAAKAPSASHSDTNLNDSERF